MFFKIAGLPIKSSRFYISITVRARTLKRVIYTRLFFAHAYQLILLNFEVLFYVYYTLIKHFPEFYKNNRRRNRTGTKGQTIKAYKNFNVILKNTNTSGKSSIFLQVNTNHKKISGLSFHSSFVTLNEIFTIQ